jgi:hypothetical protein
MPWNHHPSESRSERTELHEVVEVGPPVAAQVPDRVRRVDADDLVLVPEELDQVVHGLPLQLSKRPPNRKNQTRPILSQVICNLQSRLVKWLGGAHLHIAPGLEGEDLVDLPTERVWHVEMGHVRFQ